MNIETKNNGLFDYKVITADEGKVLRRIRDRHISGESVALGKTWYLFDEDGKPVKLDEPVDELPEHYEEIDTPVPQEESEKEPEER